MKTQAWGWLAAAVMAAGLNASYHDGGLRWVHEFADQVVHNSNAVIDLATGRANEFLAESRILTTEEQNSTCPLANALVRVQERIADRVQSKSVQAEIAEADARFAHFQAISDREQARLIRIENDRTRIEARLANMRIPAMALSPVITPAARISLCPRLRVNVPRLPAVKVPAVPMVHIDMPGSGPV